MTLSPRLSRFTRATLKSWVEPGDEAKSTVRVCVRACAFCVCTCVCVCVCVFYVCVCACILYTYTCMCACVHVHTCAVLRKYSESVHNVSLRACMFPCVIMIKHIT